MNRYLVTFGGFHSLGTMRSCCTAGGKMTCGAALTPAGRDGDSSVSGYSA